MGKSPSKLGIGSTFPAEALASARDSCPWAEWEPSLMVQSGGQALRLISDALWKQGRRQLILPGFLCESMIEPFLNHSWKLSFYAFDRDANPQLSSFTHAVAEPSDSVAVCAAYFGRALDADWAAEILRLGNLGLVTVEDRTHSPFESAPTTCNFTIASLRKLLPVGDGGLVAGAGFDLASGVREGPGDLYWEGMDLKSVESSARQLTISKALIQQAETRFEMELQPTLSSLRTAASVPRLQFDSMAKARVENASLLIDLIPGLDVVNADWAIAPSHLVARTGTPQQKQRELAERGIYCPIHWPRPPLVPFEIPRIDNLISLPIDHRYGREEMEYIALAWIEIGKHVG